MFLNYEIINKEKEIRKTLFIEEKYKKICAEFENYKKRIVKEIDFKIKLSNEKIIEFLIPIIDNLEQAIKYGKNLEEKESETIKGVIKTVEKLNHNLKNFGLKSFETTGKVFDPEISEAISFIIDETKEDNIVIEEYQKGYILNGKLIRPSRVCVSKIKN